MLVGRAQGFDPRAVGSGNIGMTNVARAGGKGPAAMTFFGDILKGLLPVVLARFAGLAHSALALVAFAAFAGSIASIFLHFGGRSRCVSAARDVYWVLNAASNLICAGGFPRVCRNHQDCFARLDQRRDCSAAGGRGCQLSAELYSARGRRFSRGSFASSR